MEEKNASLLGVKIAVGTRDELLMRCIPLLWKGGAVCTVNPEILNEASDSIALRCALSSMLNIPDGVGVRLALRKRGVSTEVFSGVDIAPRLLDFVPVRLGIIGGREGVAAAAMKKLLSEHYMAREAFAVSGYGKRYGEYRKIMENNPADVVFVCLGSPKQELFINEMKEYFRCTLFIGLGGSADIYSGAKKRAPRAFRSLGLEWAWRMLREPRRLSKLPKIMNFFKKADKEAAISGKIGKKTPAKA